AFANSVTRLCRHCYVLMGRRRTAWLLVWYSPVRLSDHCRKKYQCAAYGAGDFNLLYCARCRFGFWTLFPRHASGSDRLSSALPVLCCTDHQLSDLVLSVAWP